MFWVEGASEQDKVQIQFGGGGEATQSIDLTVTEDI